jgi:hypothetical protein
MIVYLQFTGPAAGKQVLSTQIFDFDGQKINARNLETDKWMVCDDKASFYRLLCASHE